MNFSLGKHLEAYVADSVENGPFNNASEVVRDALRLHEERQLKLADLRQSVESGRASVVAGRVSDATQDDIIAKARQRPAVP